MLRGVKVFLDVDDMEEGLGADYVEQSTYVLIALTPAYFESHNAMRELLRAVCLHKPLITLTHTYKGVGPTLLRKQVLQHLYKAEAKYPDEDSEP